MSFAIQFLTDAVMNPDVDPGSRYGRITLGDYEERFLSLQTFWKVTDYEQHWRDSVRRLVHANENSSLITSLADPAKSNLLFWWPLYLDGDIVHVQNGILFFDQLDAPFELRDPYRSIPPRRTADDDGNRISEWHLPRYAFEQFL